MYVDTLYVVCVCVSVWCQVDLALVIEDNIPVVERGECCVMWLLNHKRHHNGCNQPPNKRLKIEGEAEKTMLEKILQEVAVSEPLEESSVKPGDEFCLVTFITLPHHQTSLSGMMIEYTYRTLGYYYAIYSW